MPKFKVGDFYEGTRNIDILRTLGYEGERWGRATARIDGVGTIWFPRLGTNGQTDIWNNTISNDLLTITETCKKDDMPNDWEKLRDNGGERYVFGRLTIPGRGQGRSFLGLFTLDRDKCNFTTRPYCLIWQRTDIAPDNVWRPPVTTDQKMFHI